MAWMISGWRARVALSAYAVLQTLAFVPEAAAQSETRDLLPQTFLDRQSGASQRSIEDTAERDAHRRALQESRRLEAEVTRERDTPAARPPPAQARAPASVEPPTLPPVAAPAIVPPVPVPVTRGETAQPPPPPVPSQPPSQASLPPPPSPAPPSSTPSAAAPFGPRSPGLMPPNTTRDMLVAQGERHLKLGDISSARLFYQRAAEAGSVDAARILSRLFDATSLAQLGARGIVADGAKSKFWLGYADRLERGELDKLSPKP